VYAQTNQTEFRTFTFFTLFSAYLIPIVYYILYGMRTKETLRP